MTIKECIDIVDNIKPNQYTVADKVNWLTFVDMTIINDVLKTHEGYDGRYDLFEGYSPDKLTASLVVPTPYDRLYTAYLSMQIDRLNGETAKYNNSASLYNTYLLEYKRYYNKTHMPLDITRKGYGEKPPKKHTVGLTAAEYENLKRDLYFALSADVNEVISPDKLYDIVTSYAYNNIEMLKGADGKTPVRGVDYFTEDDINAMVAEVLKVENEKISKLEADVDKVIEEVDKKLENIDVSIDIDKELNASSDNAVANSAVANAIGDIDTALFEIIKIQTSYTGLCYVELEDVVPPDNNEPPYIDVPITPVIPPVGGDA